MSADPKSLQVNVMGREFRVHRHTIVSKILLSQLLTAIFECCLALRPPLNRWVFSFLEIPSGPILRLREKAAVLRV